MTQHQIARTAKVGAQAAGLGVGEQFTRFKHAAA